jgi:hypothetical protein
MNESNRKRQERTLRAKIQQQIDQAQERIKGMNADERLKEFKRLTAQMTAGFDQRREMAKDLNIASCFDDLREWAEQIKRAIPEANASEVIACVAVRHGLLTFQAFSREINRARRHGRTRCRRGSKALAALRHVHLQMCSEKA